MTGTTPSAQRASSGAGALWIGAAIALAYLALLAPVLIVDIPPLLDYPAHFTRMWLIGGGAKIPPLDQMYAVDFSRAWANIGIDLMALALGGGVGKATVPVLALALAVALPSLGCLLLSRRVFGGSHWWQLAFVLPAFGKTMILGFLNFNIGVGLALVAAAFDDRLARRGPIVALIGRGLATGLILVFHPFAAIGYGGLLLALALGPDARAWFRRDGLKALAGPVLLAVAPAVIPPILLLALAPHPPVSVAGGHTPVSWAPFTSHNLASTVLSPFRGYLGWFDGLTVAALLAVVGLALAGRKLSVHAGLLLAGLAFGGLTLIMPERIGDGYFLHLRLPLIATFVLLAALRPNILVGGRGLAIAASLFLGLGLARTGVVAAAWWNAQSDVRAVREALRSVPAGSSVLPAAHDIREDQMAGAPFGRYYALHAMIWHLPELAISQQHAFVPNIFSIPGQQPLRIRERWAPMSDMHADKPVRPSELAAGNFPPAHRYLEHWRSFDYMLVINADLPDADGGTFPAADLELVADKGFAVLYRIRHPAAAGAAQP